MKKNLYTFLLMGALSASAFSAQAETIFGLTATNQIIVMNNPSTPATVSGPYTITGMTSGQTMLAIDFRPSDGMLYGLGYNSSTSDAQLYTLSLSGTNYVATAVNSTPVTLQLGTGSSVGFDFNAIANNKISVVGTNGNNYMLNADNGSISVTGNALAYGIGDLHAAGTAGIGATAYANSFFGADATTQIGYDLTNNTIVTFDANSNDTLHSVGIGSGLALAANTGVGMDSYYDPTAHTNNTYLSAQTALSTGASLYRANTTTGLVTSLGVIGTGNVNMRDIAVQIDRNVPANVDGQLMVGLTLNMHNLVTFDSQNPDVIRDEKTITGMTNGQIMVAIDFRPADLNLYGLGYDSINQQYQLYQIDLSTGAATAINANPSTLNLGTTGKIMAGFDFNPVTDRIRVVGNGGLNVQISPTTGAVVATDSILHYASGDIHVGANANVTAIAHTNDYNSATATSLMGFDLNTGGLVMFNVTGDNGNLSSALSLSTLLGAGSNTNGAMDIFYDPTTNSNKGYVVSNNNGYNNGTDNYSNFYSMDPATGTTTAMGPVGPGVPLQDVAAKQVDRATAVNNVAAANGSDLLVYPNPSSSDIYVVLNEPAINKVFVDVMDMNGRVVRTRNYAPGSAQIHMDISTLPTGIYSMHIQEKGKTMETVKIARQ